MGGLLHSSCGRGGLASSLGGQLLPGGLASGGLSCGLLGTSHGAGQILTDTQHSSPSTYMDLAGSREAPPSAWVRDSRRLDQLSVRGRTMALEYHFVPAS